MKTFDDRLSKLPDSLILEILSLLPMRDVVKTTILSKRWRDFWTTIPCLNFKLPPKKNKGFLITLFLFCLDLEEEEEKNSERKFITQVQRHWKGIRIRNFVVSFNTKFNAPSSAETDSWLRFATEKKVQDLCLDLPFDWSSKPSESDLKYWLPQCMYSCSSIKKLWIRGCNLRIQEKAIKWDNLNSLFLQGICFSEDVINQVVSSSPRLESLELHLRSSRYDMDIRSNSLKTLTVVRYNAVDDPSHHAALTICAPKLESLHLSGNAYRNCNLLMDGSSLARADLRFYDLWCAALEETLKQILPSIKHVEAAVTLSPCAFKMLGAMQDKDYCSFPNVKKLKLDGGPVEPKDIVSLAQIFPEVETLDIDWARDDWYPLFLENLSKNSMYVESEAMIPTYFWMQLKILNIEITRGSNFSELLVVIPLAIFVTEHATKLQEIVINRESSDALALKEMDKVLTKVKRCVKWVKWGLLGTGIAVAAYAIIAALGVCRADTNTLVA